MQNKFLLFCSLIILTSFNITNAAVQKNAPTANTSNQTQIQEQVKTTNQGEDSQIKVEEQVQEKNIDAQNTNKEQTQDRIQKGAEYGYGAPVNENEDKGNQMDEINLNKNKTQTQGENNSIAEQRRSQVANAVQQMLQVADRNGGIGEQVRTIAQTQTQNQEKIEASLEKIENRKKIAKFFIGPNYNEINATQKLLDENSQQIQQLNEIKNQLSDQGDLQNLTEQIQTLEQSNLQIQNSITDSQKGFSLLGWVFKLFSK